MKINIQTKGVIITSKQKSVIEKKLLRLKRYTKDCGGVVCDVKLIDETGPEKSGVDQVFSINLVLPKETIYIRETDDRIMRAFGYAYDILERRLRRYNQKHIGNHRREASRFKSVINVVGSPFRAIGSATEAVGRFVPRRGRKKNRR